MFFDNERKQKERQYELEGRLPPGQSLTLMRDNVVFASAHAPEPLTPEHGAPLRLVVPHLYAWKSAKWVRGLDFMEQDRPGYWERVGYHIYGDPLREQRYHGQ